MSELSQTEINNIKNWYYKKNYTDTYIRKFQDTVKTKSDGIVGSNTINAVYNWQVSKNLSKDGKFGKECAEKANLTIETNEATKPETSKQDTNTNITGSGINKKPGFYKQYDYKSSPYVSKSDYNKMNSAMNGASYDTWDINSSKLKSIYQQAVTTNNGKTTIASSGCGVTSFANIKGITPTTSAEMSMKAGCRIYRKGTAGSFFSSNGGTEAGTATNALNQVAKGKYLVCSHGYGNWCKSSTGGHFIVVYGFDGTDVYVSDPNSTEPGRAKASAKKFKNSYKYGYLF